MTTHTIWINVNYFSSSIQSFVEKFLKEIMKILQATGMLIISEDMVFEFGEIGNAK
jgi:hypothetical protein